MREQTTEQWIAKQADQELAAYLADKFEDYVARGFSISQADFQRWLVEYRAPTPTGIYTIDIPSTCLRIVGPIYIGDDRK
jgi:hypothetical protein